MQYSAGRKRPVLWLYRNLISRRAVFHSTCAVESEYIKGQFPHAKRIVEIPNYIEIPEVRERRPGDYFLFVGRIHPKKAIDNLIKGLALSHEFKLSKLKLKIAGGGDQAYLDALQELAREAGVENRIEFLGQVEGEMKQQLYADAFWTFMPSHTENFGLIVIESLAQSTPVVASTGSPWASLEENDVGLWRDNSPDAIAKTVDAIIQMPGDEYRGYRDRARGFVETNYDVSKFIEKWHQLYSEPEPIES